MGHNSSITARPRRAFRFALLLIPFVFFFSVEGILRLAGYGGDTRLFIQAEPPNDSFLRVNPDIGKRYFSRQSTLPLPPNDVFLKQKPADGYRIFVLGESTALGFPYGNLLMFSRILQNRIQDTFPERRIETVNVSLTAVSSYALLEWMDEILEWEPDLILIYAGHNEFYGAMAVGSLESAGRNPVFVRLYLKCLRFKWTWLVRDIVHWTAFRFRAPAISPAGRTEKSGTLMERIAAEKSISEGTPLYRLALKQWEGNLAKILDKARQAKVPVVIGGLVSNIRDQEPFGSGDPGKTHEQSADSVFRQARELEAQGKYSDARKAYRKAKDLDLLRFRASEDFNDIIRSAAQARDEVFVDTWKAFESAAKNGLVGDNLMADHLHPNMDGAFLLADAFYETMKANHFIAADWNSPPARPAEYYRKNWPVTELDTTIAWLMIRQLKNGWPFRPAGTDNRTLLDFKRKSPAEHLAIRVIFGEISADRGHFLLARHFEASGDPDKAGREYAVIPRLVHIEAYDFLDRALSFLRAGLPEKALPLLMKSLETEQIPLARRLADEISADNRLPESP